MQPINRYKDLLDAAIIFSDILVIPQALDMEVIMSPGPIFPNPITTREAMEEMINRPIRDEDFEKKLKYVYEAIKLTVDALQSEIPLIGFVGAPWTLFAYMTSGGGSSGGLNGSKATSFDAAKKWLFLEPELSLRLLDKLASVCALHLVNQVKSGCHVIQVFDSWAGELSTYDFKKFSLPFLRKIASLVKANLIDSLIDPVPMIIFAKGVNQSDMLKALSDSGYTTVGLDWKIEPSFAIKSLEQNSTHVCLQGNLDPAILHSSPDAIKRYVKIMFDKTNGGFRGDLPHIANLGHGITPGVDPECMRTFLEAVHDEGRKARST